MKQVEVDKLAVLIKKQNLHLLQQAKKEWRLKNKKCKSAKLEILLKITHPNLLKELELKVAILVLD